MSARHWLVPFLATLAAAPGADADKRPLAVSPGSASGTTIESRCPTFSWSAVAGAEAHELVVYEVGDQGRESEPLFIERLPGSTSSWTPSLDRCLDRGGRYAWSVGVAGRAAESAWSAPRLFEVAPTPSAAEIEQALAVLRRSLEAGRDGFTDADRRLLESRSSIESRAEPAGGPAPVPRGATALGISVEGEPVLSGYERHVGLAQNCSGQATCTEGTVCPGDKKAIGGGVLSFQIGVRLVFSYPDTDSSWRARIVNTGSSSAQWEVWVVCADTL